MDDQALHAERSRLEDALKQLITMRGRIYIQGPVLTGSFGSLMQRELNIRFKPKKNDQTNAQLARWFERVYHHQKRVVSAVAVAHRRPVQVSGALATWQYWGELRKRMRLDSHLGAKAKLAVGIGSCGIRPTWSFESGSLPGLTTIPRSHLSVYTSDTNKLEPTVVVERHGSISSYGAYFQTDYVWVWDISDPENPRYEKHYTESDYWARRGSSSWALATFNDGLYPWRRADGSPFLPWSFYQGQAEATELLPVGTLAEDTWQLMIRLTWATFPEVIRGWDIPMPYGDEKINGLENSVARPHAYVPVYGKGMKGVAIAPSAVPSVLQRMDLWRQKVAMAADRYDRRLHVVDRKDAASGIALELEASQEHAAYDDQETRWAPEDAQAIENWRATWNTWVKWGLLSAPKIPEGDIQVTYQRYFTPAARNKMIQQERQAMIDGPGSPLRYHMARLGLDPKDADQRKTASDDLKLIQQEREEFAALLPKPQPAISISNDSTTKEQAA